MLEIITGSIPNSTIEVYRERVISSLSAEDIGLLEVYYNHDMSLKETADELFVHKNTIQYQLNRINELSGFNPRLFKDAVILYLALLV